MTMLTNSSLFRAKRGKKKGEGGGTVPKESALRAPVSTPLASGAEGKKEVERKKKRRRRKRYILFSFF